MTADVTVPHCGNHIQKGSVNSKRMVKIVIPGKINGLNDFIAANRRKQGNWSGGNEMKQTDQRIISAYIPKGLRFKGQIYIEYCFFEPNAKRDKDNISGYFHKVFQDALVACRVIPNDGWKEIKGWSDSFSIDRVNPRIEVRIKECREK